MSTRPQNLHTQQQAGRGKANHHHHHATAHRDRDASTKQGLQLLATSIEELRHYILTTGLQSTSNGIVHDTMGF
jgi:ribosomal protein S15P/S13E